MPEAVDSNTTRTPDSQDASRKVSQIASRFEDLRDMMEAFNVMTCAALDDQAGYPSNFSNGVTLLHRTLTEELWSLRATVLALLRQETAGRDLAGGIDSDVWSRISDMVRETYREAGRKEPDEDEWSAADGVEFTRRITHLYNALIAKLNGTRHLLDVGSLLPWLELKLRREMGLSTTLAAIPAQEEAQDVPRDLRDAFIAEKVRQGFSLPHISQALNVKVKAIERVMQRLEGGEARRKAV